ncbi:MAG: hypothetical protein HY897_19280 [Deltaproteobacteria bacterium]|nr:hypothetical protein [Deltaproteobacteria bacterium]
MEKVLSVLNEMERAGVIGRYAIGGAVGAIFYMEPVLTYDLDIFVNLAADPGALVSLTPLYEHLRAGGYEPKDEGVAIEGVTVQFLPAFNSLTEEAVAQAREITYGKTPSRVMTPEHLAAIMLQTGRPKDRERLVSFMAEAKLDRDFFEDVLARHGLTEKWKSWRGME